MTEEEVVARAAMAGVGALTKGAREFREVLTTGKELKRVTVVLWRGKGSKELVQMLQSVCVTPPSMCSVTPPRCVTPTPRCVTPLAV
eukprot:1474127-Pyramimonas_sp.AAC.1